jgi:arsenite methyltransferase
MKPAVVEQDELRQAVRERYGAVAKGGSNGCRGPVGGCCENRVTATEATELGYSEAEKASVPDGADMGLGCGNPVALASIQAGETVLDLGSGGGFDCFLAAQRTGPSGHVIGVDMTSDMVSKARANAAKIQATNVEFRLGEIEHLPVSDSSVDLVISNCVINLSPDKAQVFREAFRVLRPGGRIAVSDMVATAPIPAELRKDLAAYTGCLAGATTVEDIETMLNAAGFTGIGVTPKDESREFIREWVSGSAVTDYVVSANIEAKKPALSDGALLNSSERSPWSSRGPGRSSSTRPRAVPSRMSASH